MWITPALFRISSGESIPRELLLSRAHFRFNSIAKLTQQNYIYNLSKKTATYNSAGFFIFLPSYPSGRLFCTSL
jgi:hypothetical protein